MLLHYFLLTHSIFLFCFHVEFTSCWRKPSISVQMCAEVQRQGQTSPSSLQGAVRFHSSIWPLSFIRPRSTEAVRFRHTFSWRNPDGDVQNYNMEVHFFLHLYDMKKGWYLSCFHYFLREICFENAIRSEARQHCQMVRVWGDVEGARKDFNLPMFMKGQLWERLSSSQTCHQIQYSKLLCSYGILYHGCASWIFFKWKYLQTQARCHRVQWDCFLLPTLKRHITVLFVRHHPSIRK